jgi:hypothetical protein
LKLFQEWGERGIKGNNGVDEFNFLKYHSVTQYNNNMITLKRGKKRTHHLT